MSDYISEKIEQYERKLKQAEKAGKHNKAKKYQEKLERLARAAGEFARGHAVGAVGPRTEVAAAQR